VGNVMPDVAGRREELSFLAGETLETVQRYQQAWGTGEAARLKLALKLAAAEYRHPECETAGSTEKQRSFCRHHSRVTVKTVLLIHGFTACPFEMRELGELLYRQGYNVFGVRLAGHGVSGDDFAKTTGADWFDSARHGLAIAALLGRETVVIGESMGGALAVLLAQQYPAAVSQLILCAPCFQIKDWRAELITWSLLRKLIPRQDMGIPPEGLEAYWYRFIPTSAVVQLVKLARRARRAGGDILASTLIIQAENDGMVQPWSAQRFFESLHKLPANRKRLIYFPNGHHNLTVVLNPRKDEVFQWITDFIPR
jgi:carboxylesterase